MCANIVHMATFRKAFRFLRSNASASLMFLIYILMWWMPLRPIITLVSGRSDIPYGINGPLEWMSRWWLTADAPTLFQPIALLGAWMLAYQRIGILRATWARTCRSAARRGAKPFRPAPGRRGPRHPERRCVLPVHVAPDPGPGS